MSAVPGAFLKDGLCMKRAVDSLLNHVEAIYGLFHDSRHGWSEVLKIFQQIVKSEVAGGKSLEDALSAHVIRGKGDPGAGGKALHISTFRERMEACAVGGAHEKTLSNLCVTSIYAFWEDETRGKIAECLGIEKNAVKSDLFADLAKFRNVILHAGGKMDGRANSLKVLKWFKDGDEILIDPAKLHEIISLIREFPDGLVTEGYKPKWV